MIKRDHALSCEGDMAMEAQHEPTNECFSAQQDPLSNLMQPSKRAKHRSYYKWTRKPKNYVNKQLGQLVQEVNCVKLLT